MAKQTINIGTSPNSGTGDPLRTAFTKINQNFADTEFSHIELVTTEVAFVGPIISFTKTNYGSEVDYIDEDLAITRGIEQGIFNIAVEEEYNRDTRISPANSSVAESISIMWDAKMFYGEGGIFTPEIIDD